MFQLCGFINRLTLYIATLASFFIVFPLYFRIVSAQVAPGSESIPEFFCKARTDAARANMHTEVIRHVFDVKRQDLLQAGIINREFYEKILPFRFIICDNGDNETFVHNNSRNIIVDFGASEIQYLTSFSIILGAYVARQPNAVQNFDLYRMLVDNLRRRDGSSLQVIRERLLDEAARHTSAEFVQRTINEDRFIRRVQTSYRVSFYFLMMHEFCHIAADHARVLEMMFSGSNINSVEEVTSIRKEMELDADRCSIDIVNEDERRFTASPIAMLATLPTIGIQLMLNSPTSPTSSRTHPSTNERLEQAYDLALKYVRQFGGSNTRIYEDVVRETFMAVSEIIYEHSRK